MKFPPIRSGFGDTERFGLFGLCRFALFLFAFQYFKLLFLCIQDSVFDSISSYTVVVLSCLMMFLIVFISPMPVWCVLDFDYYFLLGMPFSGFLVYLSRGEKKVIL